MVKKNILAIGTLVLSLIMPYALQAAENANITREDSYEARENQYEFQNISNDILMKQNIVESIDEVNNIKVNGELPKIVNINNAEFIKRINKKIEDSYLGVVNAGYEKISSSFDVYNWGNITSVVIRHSTNANAGGNAKEIVKTIVFDSISQQEVTLKNLLGKDYMEYINRHIKINIDKADNDIYFKGSNAFNSIKANQDFYIDEGKLMVIFSENSIAPASTGTPVFEIPFDKIITSTLSQEEYALYNGKNYIPVSTLFRFGMNINLKQGGIMDIISSNNQVLTTIQVNHKDLNESDVILIDGYNIGLSEDFIKANLGIDISQSENFGVLEILYAMP